MLGKADRELEKADAACVESAADPEHTDAESGRPVERIRKVNDEVEPRDARFT